MPSQGQGGNHQNNQTGQSQNQQWEKKTEAYGGFPCGIWIVSGVTKVGDKGVRHNLGNTQKVEDGKVVEQTFYQAMQWGYDGGKPQEFAVGTLVLVIGEHITVTPMKDSNGGIQPGKFYASYEKARMIKLPHISAGVFTRITEQWEKRQAEQGQNQTFSTSAEPDDIPF